MKYKETTALKKIMKMKRRLRIVQGGARAGKSIAILLILIDIAQTSADQKIISIVSETIPHLKRGVMRDFLDIMHEHKYFKADSWNKTDFIYTFDTGTIIEFFSADQPSKVRGPRRNILFINECNNVSHEAYTQLTIRTSEFVYLDYNPVAEFYVHDDILPGDKSRYDFDIITYKDNECLPAEIRKEIESRSGNKNFWRVYGLGELGDSEGKIYKDWAIVDEVPHEARLERYGLDFGYSIDPAVIIAIYYYNGGYILDEITYQSGLKNRQLADIIKNLDPSLVIADSAEPKSIDELKEYGINVLPSIKGQGSVNRGINYVQDQKISMTKRSLNLIKEYRNYLWKTDKDGKITNIPDVGFDHSMDAVRYGMESLKGQVGEIYFPPMQGFGGERIEGFQL
jgi:phage terminase large subunit